MVFVMARICGASGQERFKIRFPVAHDAHSAIPGFGKALPERRGCDSGHRYRMFHLLSLADAGSTLDDDDLGHLLGGHGAELLGGGEEDVHLGRRVDVAG